MAKRSEFSRRLRRMFVYPAEALLIYPLYGLFALLPVDWASAVGGWLARTLGPRLSVSARALRNVQRALPELSPERHRAIVRGMWDNLGRVMAEHPHMERLWRLDGGSRVEMVGEANLQAASGDGRRSTLLISGHLANWELMPAGVERLGLTMTFIYRQPNNPLLNPLMTVGRRADGSKLVPKGWDGARAVIATLSRGGSVGMLVDQKMNDGIPIPFFGRPAMTAPAVAQLAYKYGSAVVMIRPERLGGARFRLTVLPPLTLLESGHPDDDIREVMTRINNQLESWIRERPEQWLWLHRRWPD